MATSTIQATRLEVGNVYRAFVAYAESSTKFWIQLESGIERLEQLHEDVVQLYANPVSRTVALCPGTVCLATYSEAGAEDTYYRGVIQSLEVGGCKVQFVDYGNTQICAITDLKYLPGKFCSFPAQAIECSLTATQSNPDIDTFLNNDDPVYIRVMDVDNCDNRYSVCIALTVDELQGTMQQPSLSNVTQTPKFTSVKFDLGKYNDACISHVETDGLFYLQLVGNAWKLDQLMCDLMKSYNVRSPCLNSVHEGLACIIFDSEDQVFYRAEVVSVADRQCTLRCVDFGMLRNVPVSSLLSVQNEHMELPMQAIKCSLSDSENYDRSALLSVLNDMMGVGLAAKVVLRTGSVFEMQLFCTSGDEDLNLIEVLKQHSVSDTKLPRSLPQKRLEESNPFTASHIDMPELVLPEVRAGSSEELYISAVLSKDLFFGQLLRFVELEDMQAALNSYYQQAHCVLKQPRMGQDCCAAFSEDHQFYRARIEKLQLPNAFVRFVDYGNGEIKPVSSLFELAPQFRKLPIQGIKCQLNPRFEIPTVGDFEAAILDKEVTVHFENMQSDCCVVDIIDCPANSCVKDLQKYVRTPVRGTPVRVVEAQELRGTSVRNSAACHEEVDRRIELMVSTESSQRANMDSGFVLPVLPVGAWEEVQVTHIDDPERFYAQLTGSGAQLDSLMEQLEVFCTALGNGGRLERAQLGMPCIAKYSEDGVWYRATITGVRRSGEVEVQFVDYGNRESMPCADLKTIPPAYMRLPVQTIQCGLLGLVSQDGLWSAGDVDSFFNMSSESPTSPVVVCVDSNFEDRYLVHMFAGGSCINQQFGQQVGKLEHSYRAPGGPPRHIGTLPSPASLEAAAARIPQTAPVRPVAQSPPPPVVTHPAPPRGTTHSSAVKQRAVNQKPAAVPSMTLKPINLEVTEYYDVYVAFVTSPSKFYIQLVTHENDLIQMMDMINIDYDSCAPDVSSVSTGQVLCAKYSQDDRWYRAQVVGVHGGGIQVHFVDYGDEETVALNNVRRLTAEYTKLPIQCIMCQLGGIRPAQGQWSDQANLKFEELTLDKPLVACMVEKSPDGSYMVELVDTAQQGQPAINEQLVRAQLAVAADAEPTQNSRRSSTSSSSSQRADTTYKRINLAAGKSVEVAMAHVNSPQQFFCHLVEFVEQLEVMMTQLDQQYTALKDSDLQLLHARVGTICAAQYSEDNSWYRAEVTAAENGKFKVKFVDYGNGEWVGSNKLKILSRDYLELPAQAVECTLSGVTAPSGDWTEKAISDFEDMTFNKTLMAKIVSSAGSVHLIRLTDVDAGSMDVAEILVKLGQAVAENGTKHVSPIGRPTPGKLPSWGSLVEQEDSVKLQPAVVTPGQRFKGFVSWMESPLDFHFQAETIVVALETLQKQLNAAYGKMRADEGNLSGPAVGNHCVALFAADGSWYRANIVAIKGDKARVMFVDYGNKQVSPLAKLKALRAEFTRDAIHAIHCSMAGVTEPPGGNWSPQVVNYFKGISSQALEIEIVSCTVAKVLVKIQDSRGKDVAQEMLNLRSGTSGKNFGNDSSQGQRSFGGRDDAPRNRNKADDSGGFGQRKDQSRSFGGPRGNDSGAFGGRRDNDRGQSGGFGAAAASSSEDWDGGAAAAPAPKATGYGAPASSGPGTKQVDVKHAEPAKPGENLQVIVTYTDSVHSFWCQRKASMTQLDVLMEKIEAYCASAKPLANPKSGSCCVAQYTADEGWYRARVVKITAGKAFVHFIDYGNTEECDLANLKELSVDHASLPAQAVRCGLEGLAGVSDRKAAEQFEELTLDKDCDLKVISNTGDVAVVQATVEGQNINSTLIQEFPSGKTSAGASPMAKTSATTPPMAAFDIPQQSTKGFVCHVESPDQFYIQLASVEDELVEYSTQVNEFYQNLDAGKLQLDTGVVGQPCCCLFEEDEAWYRGRLEEVSGTDTKVRFLDYGNSQVTEVAALRQLTAEFMKIPPYALECRLAGVKSRLEGWSDEAMDAFNGLVMDKVLDITFEGDVEPVAVELKEEGEVLNSQMVQHGEPVTRQVSPPRPQVQQDAKPGTQTQTDTAQQYAPQKISAGKQGAFISHSESPSEFYIQLPSQTNELQAYMDVLYEEYAQFGAQDKLLSDASVGQPCCAKYSGDQSWYRAVIEDINGSNITVRFVDYGNPETVPLKEIKMLVATHAVKPPYAYECTLAPDLTKVPADQFTQAVQEKDLEVEFASQSEPYVLNVSVDGKSLNELLGITEPGSAPSRSPEPVNLPEPHVPSGKHAGFISHVESATEFYVQLASQTDELQDYMDSLFEEYDALDSSYMLRSGDLVGQSCIAKYSEDGSWYRAMIEGMKDPTTAVVRFVDYGNVDSAALADVRQLTAKHGEKPLYALPCTLGADLSDVDVDTFSAALVDKELEVEFVDKSRPCLVLITSEGKPAWELLGRPAPVALSTPVTSSQPSRLFPIPNLTDGTEDAYLSHADSPGHFYIQLTKETAALEELAGQVNARYAALAEGELQMERLIKGQACCALFSEDNMWYRGVITEDTQEQITVRFVDYGNSEITEKTAIRQITEEFSSKPPFGIQCALHGCQRGWSTEDTEMFSSAIGEEEIQVTFHTTDQPAQVTVIVSGENINSKFRSNDESEVPANSNEPAIESQTTHVAISSETAVDRPSPEKVTSETPLMFPSKNRPVSSQNIQVCHVESPSSFYVQLVGELDELEGFADQLNTTYSDVEERNLSAVEIGQPCCALFSDDQLWYRALVETIDTDSVTVRFVDYGNTETTTLDNIKTLDAEYLSVAPYAIHCQLKGASSGTSWSPEDVAKFESLVLDKDLEASFNSEGSICSLLAEDEDLCAAFHPAESQPSNVEEIEARMREVEDSPLTTLPPMDAPRETLDVYVSAIRSATELYLHAAKDDEAREALTNSLNESYTTCARQLHPCSVDQVCCCKYAEDEQWYRARITHIEGDIATVLFMDFGNSDDVNIQEVYQLKHEFFELPPLAIPCQLAEVDSTWGDEEVGMLSEALLDKTLKATFLSTELPYKVQFTDETGQAIPQRTQTQDAPPEPSDKHISPTILPAVVPNEPCMVIVAHTESLQEIYLHVDEAALDDLMARLGEAYEGQNHPALSEAKPNMPAAVRYTEDDSWYRVQIMECKEDSATVTFVDYGNQDTCPLESLKELLPEFLTIPCMALECSLKGAQDLLSEETVDRFIEITSEKSLLATFINDVSGCLLELEDEGSDIVQMLLGLRPENQVDGAADDSITESPQAQLIADEEVNTNNNSGSSSPVKLEEEEEVGEEVLSKEISLSVETSERLSDMTTESKDSAGPDKEDLAVSEDCEGVSDSEGKANERVSESEDKEIERLSEDNKVVPTSEDNELVPQREDNIVIPSSEDKEVVYLGDDKEGLAVNEDHEVVPGSQGNEGLPATCPEPAKFFWPKLARDLELRVYVPHSSSPHAFHCQLADSSQEALPLLQDQIQALYSANGPVLEALMPGQHCVAQDADGCWYRAEVCGVSDTGVEVLFVDYGNTEVVQHVKAVQEEVAKLPRQAFPCSLVGILPLNEVWDEASCARFEEIVLDKDLTCTVLQVNNESDTIVMVDVELTDDSGAISQVLIDAGYAEKVEPITGGNTSRFFKESTMTSMLVDTSRAEVSQVDSSASDPTEQETQPLLAVQYQAGGDPDNFQCLIITGEEQKEAETESLCCRLAGVETDTWSEEACRLFEELCASGELHARVLSKVTEDGKIIHLVYLYNSDGEKSTRTINSILVSRGHAWLGPTSELELTSDDYEGLVQQEKPGEGENSSQDEEKENCSDGPVENDAKPDSPNDSDDENSDVDDSEPVHLTAKGISPAGGDVDIPETSAVVENKDLCAAGDA